MSSETDKARLFLLDAYALIYRAYYAFIRNPRYNSKGMNTSAVFGFTNTLNELLNNEDPSHIAVAFDTPETTEREEAFEAYKAEREEMPEDIALSIPYIRSIVEAFRIPILEKPGFEADDVIGTMAKKGEKEGFEVYMMSSDKDLAQLVTANCFLYKPSTKGKGANVMGVEEVKEKFAVGSPAQVIDILALWGDTVDNVPGVPGVGEKTAIKLVSEYGDMDGLYEKLDSVKGKLQEKLRDHREQAYLCRQLVTIHTDLDIPFDENALRRQEPDREELGRIFAELEFKDLSERILGERVSAAPSGQQIGLFEESGGESDATSPAPGLKTLETEDTDYRLIRTEDELQSLVDELSRADRFAFDTETTGTNPHFARLLGIAFSVEPGRGAYLPLPDEEEKRRSYLEILRKPLEDPGIAKVGYNVKYDRSVLRWEGIRVQGQLWDPMIVHYLVDPDSRHKLDLLAESYLSYRPVPIESLIGKKGKGQKSMADLDPEEVYRYACEDADICQQLLDALMPQLEEVQAVELYKSIEAPLITVLSEMEYQGVRIDRDALEILSKDQSERIEALEKEIHEEAGVAFNVNSPKQLGEVLFDRLKIVDKPKKTPSGQYSTSEDTLQEYVDQHPIIQKILDVRSLSKLRSTYVEALPELIHPDTGRLHTTYNQAVASTGRLSSNDPNLQNIPIRTEEGRKIRRAFVPREEGNLLFAADYSQIELRIMAHLSQDRHLMEAFRNGEDIHASTASKVYGVPIEEVGKEQRRSAKTVNFGVIYGISAFGLAQRIGISRKEAKSTIDTYFEEFPDVKAYMDASVEKARKDGYVETLMGRRRYLKDIDSNNSVVRGYAERNAINAPIQGTAADMIKLAMVRIQERLRREELEDVKMILQVHDELVFDLPEQRGETAQELVVPEMIGALSLDVPIEVETGSGTDWLEAH
jgi:DNA polymerase-1